MKTIHVLKITRESQLVQEKTFAETAATLAYALVKESKHKEAYVHLKDAVRLDPENELYQKNLEKFETEFEAIIDLFT